MIMMCADLAESGHMENENMEDEYEYRRNVLMETQSDHLESFVEALIIDSDSLVGLCDPVDVGGEQLETTVTNCDLKASQLEDTDESAEGNEPLRKSSCVISFKPMAEIWASLPSYTAFNSSMAASRTKEPEPPLPQNPSLENLPALKNDSESPLNIPSIQTTISASSDAVHQREGTGSNDNEQAHDSSRRNGTEIVEAQRSTKAASGKRSYRKKKNKSKGKKGKPTHADGVSSFAQRSASPSGSQGKLDDLLLEEKPSGSNVIEKKEGDISPARMSGSSFSGRVSRRFSNARTSSEIQNSSDLAVAVENRSYVSDKGVVNPVGIANVPQSGRSRNFQVDPRKQYRKYKCSNGDCEREWYFVTCGKPLPCRGCGTVTEPRKDPGLANLQGQHSKSFFKCPNWNCRNEWQSVWGFIGYCQTCSRCGTITFAYEEFPFGQ